MILEKIDLPNGSTMHYIDTEEEEEVKYLESRGFDVSALEAAETARLEDIKNKEYAKMNADYNGTNVSLTSQDAIGMLQIQSAFALGVTETNIEFKNGTVMNITSENFGEFAVWFATERNKLFM